MKAKHYKSILLTNIIMLTAGILLVCADIAIGGGNSSVKFLDQTGTPYGIKHIANKPRMSATPYTYDIAEGNVPNHSKVNKFGNNDDTATTVELVSDLAQAVYPYLTAAETLQVVGADVDDQGLLQDSGTATGGSALTLEDTGGDFINDSVAVGDLLLNDTKSSHGIITARTATLITVFKMDNGSSSVNEAGDVYRVANANDTGAAVVSISGLDGNYDIITEHVILNGQSDVTTTATFLRVFRCRVHLAGSSGFNEGNVTVENNASNVALARITAAKGQTLMAQWTVPEGYTFFLTSWTNGEQSNKGSEFELLARPFGEAFQIKDSMHVFGASDTRLYELPNSYGERTDIEVRVTSGGAGGSVNSGFSGWYEK